MTTRAVRRLPAWLGLAMGLGFGLAGTVALADGSGLQVRHLLSPEPGKVQALVEPDGSVSGLSSPVATDFALLLSGGQSAPNVTVRKNSDRGGLLTLVVLDDSGSYRSRAGQTVARPLLQSYSSSLGPSDRIGLVVFGTDATVCPIRSLGTDFLTDLANPEQACGAAKSNLHATNLLSGLRAALAVVRKEQEEKRALPGLVEILLFSDAGDEAAVSADDWKSVQTSADALGVRVSSILSDMPGGAGGGDQQRLASLTRLRELGDKTQGVYDNSNSPVTALQALRTGRDKQKSWLSVEAALCGIKADSASTGIDARVEYSAGGLRRAWSGSRSFKPQWTTQSEAPCPNLSSCLPSCKLWEQCTAGKCAPRACSADELCGPGARCVAGHCELLVAKSPPLWLWVLLGGLLVLLGGAATALLLRRRSREAEPKPAPSPVAPLPVKPEPVAQPAAPAEPAVVPPVVGGVAGVAVAPLLDPLPETHLVAIGGRVTIGEKWRLHKAKVYVGGSNAKEDGNDIVFSMPQISSKHALFELYPSGALWLTDLKARNGTFLNGRQLAAGERVQLRPGDQVKLSQQLILEIQRPGAEHKAPEAAPAPKVEAVPAKPAEGKPAEGKPAVAEPAKPVDKKKTVFDPGNR